MAENTPSKTEQAGTTIARQRSPNYPSIGPKEAMRFAEMIWKKDKRNPVSVDLACQHMGYKAKNGASLPIVAALKRYGFLAPVGAGEVRITDDANMIFSSPPDLPQRADLVKRLAMKPELFVEVLNKFPDGLPSDANLRFRLMQEWSFVNAKAADEFIAALKEARDLVGVAPVLENADTGGDLNAKEAATMPANPAITTPFQASSPPPAPPSAEKKEKHAWKLREGLWAEITISGTLDQKGLEKLKKYVALLDAEEETEKPSSGS